MNNAQDALDYAKENYPFLKNCIADSPKVLMGGNQTIVATTEDKIKMTTISDHEEEANGIRNRNIICILLNVPEKFNSKLNQETIIKYACNDPKLRKLDDLMGGGWLPYNQTDISYEQNLWLKMATQLDLDNEDQITTVVDFMQDAFTGKR